jgi:hypothetical protein
LKQNNWIGRIYPYNKQIKTMYKYNLEKINTEQRIYVLKCGGGFSCYGFDVVERKTKTLQAETNLITSYSNPKIGTPEHYYNYMELVDKVKELNVTTGFRSKSELNPKLIGLEGKRIQCKLHGEPARFIVGKSTGFIPTHLEIKRIDSHGGVSIDSNPNSITDIVILGQAR